MTNQWTAGIVLMVALFLIAGCSTTTKKAGEGETVAPAEVVDVSTEGTDEMTEGASTQGVAEAGAWTGDALEDPDSLLYTKTVYFAFDSSEVDPKYQDVLSAHASYLASHPRVRARLEGNCDERGSREYNIGLGERRANAVRDVLVAGGAAEDQLTVISYGEERPVATGQNEDDWALNRRVDLVY